MRGPAGDVLDQLGRGPVIEQLQQRTWNLSTLWRLRTATGPVWIKQVPAFFWHEATVLTWLAATPHAERFPVLLGHGADGRMLLDQIEGEDRYGAGVAARIEILADLHPAQVLSAASVDELVAAGVPDRRGEALVTRIRDMVDRWGGEDPALLDLVAELPARMEAVAACGLPDTLCHGDLHPGNVMGAPGRPNVIIDWGDSFVGNPAFDVLRLTENLAEPEVGTAGTGEADIIAAWAQAWRAQCSGSDPERAAALLRPVAALRLASVYADFLANIEPSEYPYHVRDVPRYLERALAFAAEPTGALELEAPR
jgi:hypothetical protein